MKKTLAITKIKTENLAPDEARGFLCARSGFDGRQDVRGLFVAVSPGGSNHPFPIGTAPPRSDPDSPRRIEPGDEQRCADVESKHAFPPGTVGEEEIGRLLRVTDEEGAVTRLEILLELEMFESDVGSGPNFERQPEFFQNPTGCCGERQFLSEHCLLLVQGTI